MGRQGCHSSLIEGLRTQKKWLRVASLEGSPTFAYVGYFPFISLKCSLTASTMAFVASGEFE
jgi:hypothetical protein